MLSKRSHMKDKTGRDLTIPELFGKGLMRVEATLEEFLVLILHIVGYIPSHTIRRFLYKSGGIMIGKASALHMGVRFYRPGNISIGEDSIIGEDSVLDGRGNLTIGNHTDVATGVMIYTSQHDQNDPYFAPIVKPVTIGDHVFIGPRAIILPGVSIGNGAIVGAGAVVTKDVGEKVMVGGVPAKEIGERKGELGYKLGRAAWFR